MESESRNTSKHVWSTDLWQTCQEFTMRKEQSLQQMVLGKFKIHMQDKIEPLTYTMHKNQLKMY